MTADQVLVFQRGGLKDQAVLAHTLLSHMGYEPMVQLTKHNAYITYNGKKVEVSSWRKVRIIEEEVLLTLE